MVEVNGVSVMAKLPSARRFFQETSLRGLNIQDAERGANGCFNNCLLFPQYVLRFPRTDGERAPHITAIGTEFASIAPGIGFRMRTPRQQITLINNANEAGLSIPRVVDTVDGAILMERVKGVTLDKYVQREPTNIDPQVIARVITHTAEAHKKNIVLGDRWSANTIVTYDKRQIVEIDHDIKLKGEPGKTKAFELAQMLYHLMHFSHGHRNFMRDTIFDIYVRNPELLTQYDLTSVRNFLVSQTRYHFDNFTTNGNLYEGFIPPDLEIYQLIDGMEEINDFYNKFNAAGDTIFQAVIKQKK